MPKSERRAGVRPRNRFLVKTSAAARLLVVAVAAGLLAGAIALPVVGLAGVAVRDAANTFNSLKVPRLGVLPSRSEILDSRGHLIAYLYPGNIDRVPVRYDQIAPVMRNAIVAIEDSRFYQHGAVDFRGTVRALVSNAQGNPVQGGSTLAQQYVKNALELTGTPQGVAAADTPVRKIRELRMAAIVEHQLTRHQLLAAYLNAAYFENDAYGIQIAAERYFSTSAAKLTLPEAALLAGLVENPSRYDPIIHKGYALARRMTVLQRMQQLGYITAAQERAAAKSPLGLRLRNTSLQSGCTSASAKEAAFFCDYVLSVLKNDTAYRQAYHALTTVGGLKIYTTMSAQDQFAAEHAVTWMVPPPPSPYNPGRKAAAEVLIQPRTGYVRAIAVDRPYGNDRAAGQDNIDYAVDTKFNGGVGVQTGSSNKIFTLLTALKDNYPFGFKLKVTSPATISGYTDCHGVSTAPFQVSNAEGPGTGVFSLYTGTTDSINVFFAHLEQMVGLCNVVKTAVSLGDHCANGQSMMVSDCVPGDKRLSASDIPAFTLGALSVSPMTMAAAYATVAARGMYCKPIAISKVVTASGKSLPVKSADCHRVLSKQVADAATHIFQGVMQSGTGAPDAIPGIPTAGKTGTGNGAEYVAFAGFTPRLVGYVSMFGNPINPVTHPMTGQDSCYRLAPSNGGGLTCPGFEFGVNAGAIWQYTFEHANLGKGIANFVPVPPNSPYYRQGSGVISSAPPHRGGPPRHGHGGPPHGGGPPRH